MRLRLGLHADVKSGVDMAPQISENVFEILRAAVNLARSEQIRKVHTLKARLLDFYPGQEEDINKAISVWGEYVQSKGTVTLIGRAA